MQVHPALTCLRDETIGRAQALLIESAHGIVLILEAADGLVIGLLTLHDLLRAQDALAQQAESFGDVPHAA